MVYTDEHIEALIACEKKIVSPPSMEYKEERGHMKKNFSMLSTIDNFSFRGFIRYNMMFIDNFSVGLDYEPREEKGTICLIRCNGTHGENKHLPHHKSFHLHRATAETINSGGRAESFVEPTTEDATLEQAIQYFIKKINLTMADRYKYFPDIQRLFD